MLDPSELSHAQYSEFAQFLEQQCGIVLGENKAYLVRSRLMPIVRENRFSTLAELLSKVVQSARGELAIKVVDAMTTNETLWFRDRYPFELMEKQLLQMLAQSKRKLRIWSAACSSGQEPYSLAMLVKEFKKKNPSAFPQGVEIIATDLSSDMLTRAKQGKYDMLSIGRGLPDHMRNQYFTATHDGFMQLSLDIKSMVQFRSLNLLNQYSELGSFDVVFCRNVLIYFSAANKRKILQQIAASLQSQGILFLGASESISEVTEIFELVRCSPGLYYRKKS